jgi:hypothetical protein
MITAGRDTTTPDWGGGGLLGGRPLPSGRDWVRGGAGVSAEAETVEGDATGRVG